ncbi:MAG: hypothetical protein WD184_04275 [Acidimicrobiia bacterium]
MSAFVGGTVPGDDADVVAVAKHVVHVGGVERLAVVDPGGVSSKTERFEFFAESAEAPLAACVGVECPADGGGSFGVDLDRTDLPPVNFGADVEVAEGCPVRGATTLGFLAHAFAGLGGEVG